jgi:hypothetical protein
MAEIERFSALANRPERTTRAPVRFSALFADLGQYVRRPIIAKDNVARREPPDLP